MLFSLKLSNTFIYSGFFREGGDRGAAAAAVQEEAEADLGPALGLARPAWPDLGGMLGV